MVNKIQRWSTMTIWLTILVVLAIHVSGAAATVGTVKFVTIGDAHIGSSGGLANFTKAVNYINNMTGVDFVVQMGDITDTATVANFTLAKAALVRLKKRYYVVEGNHDIGKPSGENFRKYIGPTEHIENINGYQLIFVGIIINGSAFSWSFDYSRANNSKPTIVFNHGPVKPNPNSKIGDCVKSWNGLYYGYACSMSGAIGRFSKLMGVYAGHVHASTVSRVNSATYVTEDNLGGFGPATDYIGYTVIRNGVVSYSMVKYR